MPKSSAKAKAAPAIAVTGLKTYIARQTIKRLLREGARVVCIDIHKPDDLPETAIFYKVDLTLPTSDAILADIFRREKIGTLIHLAFLSHPHRNTSYMHELQVIGTLQLLHACAAEKVQHIVVKTSTMVYGAHPLNPNYLTEAAELRGAPGYRWVEDLVEVESLLARYRRKNPNAYVVNLRCAPILGPTVRNLTTYTYSRPAIVTLFGYDPLLQFLHEEDAVAAVLAAAKAKRSGPYNIAGAGVLPLSSSIYLAGRVNLPIFHPLAYSTVRTAWLAGMSAYPGEHLDYLRFLYVADCSRAQSELGFTPQFSSRETMEQFAGVQRLRDVHLAA